jgi:uncharacterized protein involved in exopolysaccharide biosynthesis
VNIVDVINFTKKYFLFLLVVSVFSSICGLVLAINLPPLFEATQTLFVKRQASPESKQFYAYDGYYSAQAAERFADSIFGALKSREVLRYAITRVTPEAEINPLLNKEVRSIKVIRLSPQLISFSYSNKSRDLAEKLIVNLSGSVSGIASELNRGGDENISISFVSPKPLVSVSELHPILGWLVGLMLGAFLAVLISASHYFYKNIPS